MGVDDNGSSPAATRNFRLSTVRALPNGCAFSLPRNAKGKRLSVAITATVEDQSKTITSSFRVR
jgi:hypothetical protein